MRRMLLVSVILAATVAGGALAQERKIGFVNTGLIFSQYSAAKEAQTAYEKEMDELNREVSGREGEIKAMADTLEARKYLFSEERLKEKRQELERKQQDYLRFRQEAEARAAKRNDELSKPIVEAIESATSRAAEKDGFDLVLDSTAGIVIYSTPELDLTDKVLQLLEESRTGTQ